jgi:L-lactate dehydrogenase complex protein LldG
MSSRDDILSAVRRHRPASVALPDIPSFGAPDGDRVAHFMDMVRAIGGTALEVAPAEVAAALATAYPDQTNVASTAREYGAGTIGLDAVTDPHDLAHLDLLVCRGTLGVAENGAVWVPASQMGHRAAPFLTQHLALIVARAEIVWSMHEAYARLRIDADGFGAFIAGPSKTADIEQALVIGAHGPRSLTVLVVYSGGYSG